MQFFNESVRNVIKISLKFVPKGSINNKEALGQVMAWFLTGYKPLPAPSSPTYKCGTSGRQVKS